MKFGSFAFAPAALVAVVGLSGCVSTVQVKEVVAKPDDHLRTFTVTSLTNEVVAGIPRNTGAAPFTRIELVKSVEEKRSDDKAERAVTVKTVMVSAGGGYVQAYDEISNNQVPFRINYKLSYRGIVPLQWQTVFLNRQVSDPAQEVNKVVKFDPIAAAPAAGTSLEYKLASGARGTGASREARDSCTVGAARPAKDVNAAFQGQSIDVVCENYGFNGQYVGKSTYAYLSHYGVAVLTEYFDSSTKATMKVTSAVVR